MTEHAIIDVGAFIGETAINTWQRAPHNKMWAFEPCKTNFEKLKNTIEWFKQKSGLNPDITLVQKAVSTSNENKTFYETRDAVCASLLPFSKDKLKWEVGSSPLGHTQFDVIDEYEVECIRLDDFLDANNIKSVEHLKVDAQGHDLDVIKSLGSRLKDVRTIVAEARLTDFHMYEGDCHKDELVQYMKDNGFSARDFQKQTYDQEENILFVRD